MTENRSVATVVSKSWGFEKHIINTDRYCGKLLYIVKGQFTSLHYHKIKDETFYVHSGKIQVYYGDNILEIKEQVKKFGVSVCSVLEKTTLGPGDSFRIQPGRVHRIIAALDTEMYEFSTTHEENDTIRFTGV